MNKIFALQQYLEAAADMLGDDWVPNKEQWAKIRSKIFDACDEQEQHYTNDDVSSNILERVEYLESVVFARASNEQASLTGTSMPRMRTEPVTQSDSIETFRNINHQDNPSQSILPVKRATDINFHDSGPNDSTPTGMRSVTPNIDTSTGNYKSPLE